MPRSAKCAQTHPNVEKDQKYRGSLAYGRGETLDGRAEGAHHHPMAWTSSATSTDHRRSPPTPHIELNPTPSLQKHTEAGVGRQKRKIQGPTGIRVR